MSLRPRQGEGPMSYLNRSQFYPLTLSVTSFPSCLSQLRGKAPRGGLVAGRRPDGSPSGCERNTLAASGLKQDSIVQVGHLKKQNYVCSSQTCVFVVSILCLPVFSERYHGRVRGGQVPRRAAEELEILALPPAHSQAESPGHRY